MKRYLIAVPGLVLGVLLSAGCGPLPPSPGLVDDLRILAVRAEPPEVAPNEAITMEALVADPGGQGRAVSILWGVCIPDTIEGLTDCNSETAIPIGFGSSITYVIPAEALDELDPADREMGVELFIAVFATADSEERIAIKRIRISESAEPNVNPELLTTNLVGANPTEFEVETSDADDDPLAVTWLTDVGTFDRYQSFVDPPQTTWTAAMWTAETTRTGTAWVVVRDSRGGVAWFESPVN